MTPLDIAGKHESHESALVFIDYLQKKFHLIEKLFVSIRIKDKASKQSVVSAPKSKDMFNDVDDEK